MMKINLYILTIVLFVIFTINSCDKTEVKPPEPGKYATGIFITNEGPFTDGSGTITYINRDSNATENEIFARVNGRPLGSIVQSMSVFDKLAYIVVNNSNKIEVVTAETFESVALIEDVMLPNRFLGINENKAYVSSFENHLSVIDLNSHTVIKTIPTGSGPDKMLMHDGNVYVLNLGGYGLDSTLTVINAESDEVIQTLQIENKPTGIQIDKNGKLWVMCSGKGWNGFPQADDTEGHLLCIDPFDMSILKDFIFPTKTNHPQELLINETGDILFYNMPDGIYDLSINADNIKQSALIQTNTMFYRIGYDPIEKYLYASNPLDYAQNGWIYRFDKNSAQMVDSVGSGVVPGGYWFN